MMSGVLQSARRGRRICLFSGVASGSSVSVSGTAVSRGMCRSLASSSASYLAPLSTARNRPLQHLLLNPPRHGLLFSSASSSSSADAKAEKGGEEQPALPYQDVAFPWRSAPRMQLSFFQAVGKWMSAIMPQIFIRGLFFMSVGKLMDAPADDLREILFRSTRFAFIQAVRGIFDGQCKTPPPTWEYTNEELNPPSTEWELGYPPLSAMMEPKLLEIYQDVVARFRVNKRAVRLEMESIHPVAMHDFKLVIGPSRGMPLPPGATKHTRGGVTVIVPQMPEGGGQEGGGKGENQSFVQQIRGSQNHLLFQMAVTFRCRELFVVKNEETEEVVQGVEEVMDTEHRVLFEIDFDNRAQLSQEWRLVDIDGWLDGNVYLPDIPDGGEVPTEGGEGAHNRRKDD